MASAPEAAIPVVEGIPQYRSVVVPLSNGVARLVTSPFLEDHVVIENIDLTLEREEQQRQIRERQEARDRVAAAAAARIPKKVVLPNSSLGWFLKEKVGKIFIWVEF